MCGLRAPKSRLTREVSWVGRRWCRLEDIRGTFLRNVWKNPKPQNHQPIGTATQLLKYFTASWTTTKKFKSTRILRSHGHHWRYSSKHYGLWIKHAALGLGRTCRMFFLYSGCPIHTFCYYLYPQHPGKAYSLLFFQSGWY